MNDTLLTVYSVTLDCMKKSTLKYHKTSTYASSESFTIDTPQHAFCNLVLSQNIPALDKDKSK